MTTDTFRRHARARVDAEIHRVFLSNRLDRARRSLFERLLHVVRGRSDLLTTPQITSVVALRSFLGFARELERDPEDWTGATGHPLRVVASLASHLFGRYPVPRFLASTWFARGGPDRIERQRWVIAHARGQRFRSLALPLAMTRRMEHAFLRTPDHLEIDHALRRAEVLGLGGTPETRRRAARELVSPTSSTIPTAGVQRSPGSRAAIRSTSRRSVRSSTTCMQTWRSTCADARSRR